MFVLLKSSTTIPPTYSLSEMVEPLAIITLVFVITTSTPSGDRIVPENENAFLFIHFMLTTSTIAWSLTLKVLRPFSRSKQFRRFMTNLFVLRTATTFLSLSKNSPDTLAPFVVMENTSKFLPHDLTRGTCLVRPGVTTRHPPTKKY